MGSNGALRQPGLTLNEIIAAIQLPEYFKRHYTTQQLYGVVEHHVRQIYTGLFGGLTKTRRICFRCLHLNAQKLIAGFGGVERVRDAIDAALAADDFRWAIEMALAGPMSAMPAAERTPGRLKIECA